MFLVFPAFFCQFAFSTNCEPKLSGSRKRKAVKADIPSTSESEVNKRELEVSEIVETSEGATASVHGVCVSLSLVRQCKNKPDCKYFEGKLSDG